MDLRNMVQNKLNKNQTEEKRMDAAKDCLDKCVVKKMQTIMIGALASVEQNFGFLWGYNENRELTPEEEELKDIFNKVRSEILDKGNGQVRNFKTELGLYKIELAKKTIQLPIAIPLS